MRIKITWKYCLAFYCMTMLYVSFHELVHHFVGAVICGDWGYKSFNYFETACSDENKWQYLSTYAGPVFTFIVMWIGAWMLKREKGSEYNKQLGFALIFAQLPLQRMMMPFLKGNDEYYASAKIFGSSDELMWLVALIIWIICIPPLIQAYKSIQNNRRWLWFLLYFTLFPYLLWGPIFGGLEYLLVNKGVLDGTIIGIAHLFILNEIVTIIGYIYTKKYFDTALN